MRLLRTLFLRAWVVGPCLFALTTLAQPQTPAKPASLRFLFIDESAGAYALKLGTDFRALSSAPYSISAPFTPSDFRPLEIYKTNPASATDSPQPDRIKIATVTPPADTTAVLVIVTPRLENGAPAFHVELVPSDPRSFPGGSIRVLNRGRSTLAVQFATHQVLAEPGSVQLLQPVADQRGRIRARVAVQTPEEWKLISDRVAIVKPETRLTGVLVYSPSGMKFRFGGDVLAERGDPPPGHAWLTYTDTP